MIVKAICTTGFRIDAMMVRTSSARGHEEGKTKTMLIEETKKAPPGRCLWFDDFCLVLNYRAAV